MGRSVSYPSNTAGLSFAHVEIEDQWDWDDLVDDFRHEVGRLFPSTYADDRWLGREDHVLVSNAFAHFGLSEYCGMVAYWVVPRDDLDGSAAALAQGWCNRIAPRFEAHFGDLVKVGNFSNGGGVYARRDGKPVGPDNLDGPVVINGMLTDG